MTQTLQEALLKAGLVKKSEAPKKKVLSSKPSAPAKKPGFLEGKHHHHLRTECEVCSKNLPDVEYYEHANKILGPKKWLCVTCADNNNILDNCRQTIQSQHSQSRVFRRQYGPTKVFK